MYWKMAIILCFLLTIFISVTGESYKGRLMNDQHQMKLEKSLVPKSPIQQPSYQRKVHKPAFISSSSKQQTILIEKEAKNEPIDLEIRIRNTFLHIVYMVSASELLTRLSIFLSDSHIDHLKRIIKLRGSWKNTHLPTILLVTLNVQVYLLWRFSGIDKSLIWKHFTCICDPTTIRRSQHPHTVLSHAFSHRIGDHLLANMLSLSLYAPLVLQYLGTYRSFFYFYIGSIYFSTFFNDVLYRWLPKKLKLCDKTGINGYIIRLYQRLSHRLFHRSLVSGLGASGATSALSMLFILTYTHGRYNLGLLGNVLAGILILSELIPLVDKQIFGRDRDDNIGYGAHLGGHIFGLIVWITIRGRRKYQ